MDLMLELAQKSHATEQILQSLLKMDELLFNMTKTLPESAFPISTVQNEGHI